MLHLLYTRSSCVQQPLTNPPPHRLHPVHSLGVGLQQLEQHHGARSCRSARPVHEGLGGVRRAPRGDRGTSGGVVETQVEAQVAVGRVPAEGGERSGRQGQLDLRTHASAHNKLIRAMLVRCSSGAGGGQLWASCCGMRKRTQK